MFNEKLINEDLVVWFFLIWALEMFYLKKKFIFSHVSGMSGIRHIFHTGGGKCLL